MSGSSSKEKKADLVAKATFHILMERGHQAITYSQIARKSGVSRAWIYKYYAKTIEEVIQNTVQYFAKNFLRINEKSNAQDQSSWLQQFENGMLQALDDAENNPNLIFGYYRFKPTRSPIGDYLNQIERDYNEQQKAEMAFALKLSPSQLALLIELVNSLRMGLLFQWLVGTELKKIPKQKLAYLAKQMLIALVNKQL